MKKSLVALAVLAVPAVGALAPTAGAQILLTTSGNYTQNFNALASGLPNGVQDYTGATATTLGTPSALVTAPTSWGDGSGAFKNFASATGLTSNASVATQAASTDRALGVRQTATFGDPGASFVFTLQDTSGYANFALTLDLQMLSVQTRSTTFTIDYNVGGGSFTTIGTYSDPGIFGTTAFAYNFGTALDNQALAVNVRVSALTTSTGSVNRDSVGVDNFTLTYSVPEPSTYAMMAGGLGLLLVVRRARRRTLRV